MGTFFSSGHSAGMRPAASRSASEQCEAVLVAGLTFLQSRLNPGGPRPAAMATGFACRKIHFLQPLAPERGGGGRADLILMLKLKLD